MPGDYIGSSYITVDYRYTDIDRQVNACDIILTKTEIVKKI